MNSFLRDLIGVLKSRVTVLICGLATSVLTARYLGPVGSGLLATLTVYPELFITVGSRGFSQAATFFIGQKKYRDEDVFASIFYVWIVSCVVCVSLCVCILKFVTKTEFSNWIIFLAVLPLPFSFFNTFASGIFLGKNNVREFNKVNWVPNVIKLIGTIIFVVIVSWSVEGAMIGIILGYFLLTFLVFPKLTHLIKLSFKFTYEVCKNLLSLGSVYAIALIVISLNYQVGVMILERLSNAFEVGIYTKGVSVVQYLWEVPTLLSTIIFARSASAIDSRDFSYKVCLLLRICAVIIGVLSIIFFFLSGFIMTTMYGDAFLPSSTAQKILIPGILLLTIFKVLNMDLTGRGKPWIAMKAMIPSLILNIILNILLDAEYGAQGAAMSSTVSYSFSALLFIHFYSKEVQIPVKEILKFSASDFYIFTTAFKSLKNKNGKSL